MRRLTAIVMAFALVGLATSTQGQPANCPHPAVSGVAVTPNSLIGGTLHFTVDITFGGTIPQGCLHFFTPTSSDPTAVSVGPPSNFFGDGTARKRVSGISRVVDATKSVTLTYQAHESQNGPAVGPAVSASPVTVTPIELLSFTVSANQLTRGQTATGTILLKGIVHNLSGKARVVLSAAPAAAVQMPGFIEIRCCSTDGAGHAKGTFSIKAREVAHDTPVTISVHRPNQAVTTRTITVKP